MNLNQITVPSLDLTKSIPFYEKIGLKLIVKALPDYARFECPDGNLVILYYGGVNRRNPPWKI